MQLGDSPHHSFSNRYERRERERRISDVAGGLPRSKQQNRSNSRSRIERNVSEPRGQYIEHLLTIRKNLQKAHRFTTESAAHDTHHEPKKASWLKKRNFFERSADQPASVRGGVSTHKELINWARVEIQLIVEEYKITWADLGKLRDILTFKSLLEYLLQMLRGLAGRVDGSYREESRPPMEAEVKLLKQGNLMLKRSENWAKLKLQEVKTDWQEATEKINRLQGQLDLQKTQLYRLGQLCESKDQLIQKLERSQLTFKGDSRRHDSYTEVESLRYENSRLNDELRNNAQTLCRLERIINEKDQQYDRISTDKSRLLKLYASLEKEKMESSRFYEDELLSTIRKLCDERRHLSPMRPSRSQTQHYTPSMMMPSPFTNKVTLEEPPEGRKQILDLVLHSLNTLERRQDEFKQQRKQIAKSRQKLFKQVTRTSQQLEVLSKEIHKLSPDKAQYNTAKSLAASAMTGRPNLSEGSPFPNKQLRREF